MKKLKSMGILPMHRGYTPCDLKNFCAKRGPFCDP